MLVFARFSEPRPSQLAAIANDAHANDRPEHLIIGIAYSSVLQLIRAARGLYTGLSHRRADSRSLEKMGVTCRI